MASSYERERCLRACQRRRRNGGVPFCCHCSGRARVCDDRAESHVTRAGRPREARRKSLQSLEKISRVTDLSSFKNRMSCARAARPRARPPGGPPAPVRPVHAAVRGAEHAGALARAFCLRLQTVSAAGGPLAGFCRGSCTLRSLRSLKETFTLPSAYSAHEPGMRATAARKPSSVTTEAVRERPGGLHSPGGVAAAPTAGAVGALAIAEKPFLARYSTVSSEVICVPRAPRRLLEKHM